MAKIKTDESLVSSGVDNLIRRLREEGVSEGKTEAERIIADARARAAQIIKEAEQKAEQVTGEARREAEAFKTGGEDALHIAMRDTILALKGQLSDLVSDQVKRLISREMQQEDFLIRLILEVAGKVRSQSGLDNEKNVEVLLPTSLVGIEDLRKNPLELREGTLSHFIVSVANDVLREGFVLRKDDGIESGIRLYLKDKDVLIDLSDESVASVLLEHLQPRFRAILEGMVK
jgi:V/A-type H+-transporting ATPase subunit E